MKTSANILPRAAVKWLTEAAFTPVAHSDPLARIKAVEKAIARVKREFPQCFRTDEAIWGDSE